MYRWYGLDEVPGDWGRSVVTIGVFDGVHRGHQRIIARTAGTAASLELPMVVITFDPHPAEVIRPGSHPTLLCTPDRRAELLDGQGADAVLLLPFTLEFSRLGPEEFVHEVLVDRLHTAAVVVGENFTFGHRAAGDVALLAELGEKYDFTAEGLPLLADDGITVSSSDIRQKLAAGDVAGAVLETARQVDHGRGPVGEPPRDPSPPAAPTGLAAAGNLIGPVARPCAPRWPSLGPRA